MDDKERKQLTAAIEYLDADRYDADDEAGDYVYGENTSGVYKVDFFDMIDLGKRLTAPWSGEGEPENVYSLWCGDAVTERLA